MTFNQEQLDLIDKSAELAAIKTVEAHMLHCPVKKLAGRVHRIELFLAAAFGTGGLAGLLWKLIG